jgi:sigma54-dependent transcription regulator
MKYFQYIDYDVWGNEKDGYEVNNLISQGIGFRVADDSIVTKEHLIEVLRRGEYTKNGLRRKSFDWEIDLFELTYKGRPVGRFDEIDKEKWESLLTSTWSIWRTNFKAFSITANRITKL